MFETGADIRWINNVVSVSEYTLEFTVARVKVPLTSECRGTDTEVSPMYLKLSGNVIAYAPRPIFCVSGSCFWGAEKRDAKGSEFRKRLNPLDIRTSLFCFVRVFGKVVKYSIKAE